MNNDQRARQLLATTREYGVLYYTLCYLNWEFGLEQEIVLADISTDFGGDSADNRLRYPQLAWLADEPVTLATLREQNRREGSWGALHESFSAWAQSRYGLRRTSDWQSVLDAQTAVMPAWDRELPEQVELEHDVVAWFIARSRHGLKCCPLDDQPPGLIVVRDPAGLCGLALGPDRACWELDSGLLEARRAFGGRDAPDFSMSA